ncbi:hypothetical protein BN2476_960055 [Paraburkholderia piptadeniae]|uniref:Uncharacterized protein n=1 Tax=Paraburkholderia piptadeniae TaxID=1701573 RepID=A0A1N7SU64_9BURK|nr:hypothetical protein BN2476_960055 [Paraburkholderia piptadeniae]
MVFCSKATANFCRALLDIPMMVRIKLLFIGRLKNRSLTHEHRRSSGRLGRLDEDDSTL